MNISRTHYYFHELIFPTLLFVVLGGMTWAVRGCSGFGGSNGCLFAGITLGTAWWFLSYDPKRLSIRPYSNAFALMAMTLGIAVAGARGWMQWASFFEGRMYTNYPAGEYVSIPRYYGFIWQFISGIPWAGLGACFLAWASCERETTKKDWIIRILCAIGGIVVAMFLFDNFPNIFLPLYSTMKERYMDLQNNPNLRRLINDNRSAITHLGLYLGILTGEILRKDKRNITLILTVGVINGIGWALLQNWKWAQGIWEGYHFNWWRCWETSGGISLGFAYGIAYFLTNQPLHSSMSNNVIKVKPATERMTLFLTVFLAIALSLRNGIKGWANIYLGNEEYWSNLLWLVFVPIIIIGIIIIVSYVRQTSNEPQFEKNPFPKYSYIIWTVLLIQNFIAQLVKGPWSNWVEVSFAIYYILLFFISVPIIYHYQYLKLREDLSM